MTTHAERFEAILDDVRVQEAIDVRDELAHSVKVGPFDDRGSSPPGSERGVGFAIFIGEWRLGWWAKREEACEVAQRLSGALRAHPTERDQRRRARARAKL